MAILSTEVNKIQYVSNGTVGPYTFPYLFLQDADLQVIVTEIATGTDTTQILGTDYTCTGAGVEAGGSITFVSGHQPATTTYRITIIREVDYKQETDYTEGDNFPAETHENALTKLTMECQQLKALYDRSIKAPATDTADLSELPNAVERASKYLAFDAAGDVTVSTGIVAIPTSTLGEQLMDVADAATARGLIGMSTFGGSLTAASDAAAAQAVLELPDQMAMPCVLMRRTAPGVWKVYDPDGNEIDTSSSTTDGLQEAITYACTYGYDLDVYGGGVQPGSPAADIATINCTTGIVFPAMQNKTIRIGACTVNFTPAVTAEGVTFDSCMMVDVDWHGQIVYQGNSAALLFKPANPVPYDLVTGLLDSKFKVNHVALIGGTNPICVSFNATTGAIVGCRFESFELNGTSTAGSVGLRLTSPTQGILGNVFAFNRVHLCKTAGIQIGTTTTNATNIYGNHFEGHIFGASGGTTVGIDVYGTNNTYVGSILSNEGALTTGVTFESTAAQNRFTIGKNDGTTTVSGNTTLNNMVNGECTFTWTPSMTFATPGNLSVAYTNQVGYGIRIGNQASLSFRIDTSTWTHTSASGNLRMAGLPFTSVTASLYPAMGAVRTTNLTFTGFVTSLVGSNQSYIEFVASASAGTGGTLTTANAPSGTNFEIIGSITYRIA